MIKPRLRARGAQNPDLLSPERNNQTSTPTVSMAGNFSTLQVIAPSGAELELGDRLEEQHKAGYLFTVVLRGPNGFPIVMRYEGLQSLSLTLSRATSTWARTSGPFSTLLVVKGIWRLDQGWRMSAWVTWIPREALVPSTLIWAIRQPSRDLMC